MNGHGAMNLIIVYAATLPRGGHVLGQGAVEEDGRARIQPIVEDATAPLGLVAREDAIDQCRLPLERVVHTPAVVERQVAGQIAIDDAWHRIAGSGSAGVHGAAVPCPVGDEAIAQHRPTARKNSHAAAVRIVSCAGVGIARGDGEAIEQRG